MSPLVSKRLYSTGVAHPAPYTDVLIPIFAKALDGYWRVLDPMAGVGKIHLLRNFGFETWGLELEPEWAWCSDYGGDKWTYIGSVFDLPHPYQPEGFDSICVSPAFGNRYADSHNARDGSLRRSYTHDLGRRLHPDNSGTLHWGNAYREWHERAWERALTALRLGGRFVLNCKDHFRNHKRQYVCRWHVTTLKRLGLTLIETIPVTTPGMRVGTNRDARLIEKVYVFVLEKKS